MPDPNISCSGLSTCIYSWMGFALMIFATYQHIFLLSVSARFKEPVFPVPGPHQSDRCRDGAVSPVSSVLPLSAQPESDGCDGGHTGSPAHLCTTTAAPQHQADEGTSGMWIMQHMCLTYPFILFSWHFFVLMRVVLPGQGCVSFGRAVQPADSQPGWDWSDRKLSGAPGHPP